MSAALSLLVDLSERCGIAGQSDRAGTVDGRNGNAAGIFFHQARGFLAGNSHRQHGTLAGRSVLQTAAVESDANGILEREDAGNVGCRHLAGTMTEDRGGFDAP